VANRGTKNKLAPPVPLVKNFTSCLGDGWRVVCARKKLRIGGDTIHDRNITIHVGGNSFPIWGRTLFVSGKNLLSLDKAPLLYAECSCLEPDAKFLKQSTFTLKQNIAVPALLAGVSGKTLLIRGNELHH
jgi:hypothetical protein